MPPAIVTAQSSRAGIISGLIVSIIIGVAMIVVAVYYSQQASKTETKLASLSAEMKSVAPEGATADPRVNALIALKDQPQYQGLGTALEVSMAEADNLGKLLAGVPADKAENQARALLNSTSQELENLAKKQLITGTLGPNATLATAITTLTGDVTQLASEKQDLQGQLAAANQKAQETLKAEDDALKQKDQKIAAATARAEQAETAAKNYQQQVEAMTAAVQATGNQAISKIQQVNADLTKQVQATNKKLADEDKTLTQLRSKLHLSRVNPNEAIIQHPDGRISRISDQNTCFIDIGSRQSVTKGLTFEVYDKNKGIPPLGDGMSDTNMPVGKASIEVFNVGPDTSECRVTNLRQGEQLVIGDLITNLVYDPNIHYNFVVYGDFDLSNSGISSPTDIEIVKRLITQWGGRVQNQVDADTDFVVMGKEPEVPNVSDTSDPVRMASVERKKKDLDQYRSVIDKAGQFTVPIMNQNRFLYFIGYYDQARR